MIKIKFISKHDFSTLIECESILCPEKYSHVVLNEDIYYVLYVILSPKIGVVCVVSPINNPIMPTQEEPRGGKTYHGACSGCTADISECALCRYKTADLEKNSKNNRESNGAKDFCKNAISKFSKFLMY